MHPTVDTEALLAGERSALARAITLAEGQRPEQRAASRALVAELHDRHAGRALRSLRLGITGSPGAGKSTLIEAYGRSLTAAGHRVAVLAVDPSSSRTRGSILGDKTRMPELSRDSRAFVRPSPAGRTLGGVTRATREAVFLCECAGYDRVIVETVGVGQNEHAVAQLVDCMVLLVLPGSGDELQGIKRGIVELADLVVVHKADGPRERSARDTAGDYRRALHLQPARADGWSPRALTASSMSDGGLTGFGESLRDYLTALGTEGREARRRRQAVAHFERDWEPAVLDALVQSPGVADQLGKLRESVASGRLAASVAAGQLADDIAARLA